VVWILHSRAQQRQRRGVESCGSDWSPSHASSTPKLYGKDVLEPRGFELRHVGFAASPLGSNGSSAARPPFSPHEAARFQQSLSDVDGRLTRISSLFLAIMDETP
jgi:hypothetical protein